MRSSGVAKGSVSNNTSSLLQCVVRSFARPLGRSCRRTHLAYRAGSWALMIGLASLVGREKPPAKRNRHIKLTGATNTVNRDQGTKTRALAGRKGCTANLTGAIVAFVVDASHQLRRTGKGVKKFVRTGHDHRTGQAGDGTHTVTPVDLRDTVAKISPRCGAYQFDRGRVRRGHCPREVGRITIEKEQDDYGRGVTSRYPGGTLCPP